MLSLYSISSIACSLGRDNASRCRMTMVCKYWNAHLVHDKLSWIPGKPAAIAELIKESHQGTLAGSRIQVDECIKVISHVLDTFQLASEEYWLLKPFIFGLVAPNGHAELLRFLIEKNQPFFNVSRSTLWFAFQKAAANGHCEILKFLCSKFDLTIDDVRSQENCVLVMTAKHGHVSVMNFLIATFSGLTHVDVLLGSTHNDSCMSVAAENGHVEIMRILVNNFGITREHFRSHKNHAFIMAAANGRLEAARYLVDTIGLSADDARLDSNHALKNVVGNGDIKTLRYLVENLGLDTAEDAACLLLVKGKSSFFEAIYKGHVDVVKYLVETFGFTLQDMLGVYHNFNLSFASLFGDIDVLKMNMQAATNAKTAGESDYLQFQNKQIEMLQYLIRTFSLTRQDLFCRNKTLFVNAATYGHASVMKLLIQTCDTMANAPHENREKNNIFQAAVLGGNLQVVKLVVEAFGINADDARADKNHALRTAVQFGHLSVLQFLVEELHLALPGDALDIEQDAIFGAARRGNISTLRYMFSTFGLSLSSSELISAIFAAAFPGKHEQCVRFLLGFLETRMKRKNKKLSDCVIPNVVWDYLNARNCIVFSNNNTDSSPSIFTLGFNPLHGNRFEIVGMLLKAFKPCTTNASVQRLFETAICCGISDLAKTLHASNLKVVLDARKDHNSLMRMFAKRGEIDMLRFLVDAFNLTADDARAGAACSAFQMAAAHGHVNVLEFLVEFLGMTVDDARSNDCLAFRTAACNGHVLVLQYFVDKLHMTASDARQHQNMAFRAAACSGHVSVLWYLKTFLRLTLEDARSVDNYALRGAMSCGHLDVVRFLVSNFELTRRDVCSGECEALECAVWGNNLSCVKFFTETFSLDKEEGHVNNFVHLLRIAANQGFSPMLEYLFMKLYPALLKPRLSEPQQVLLLSAIEIFSRDNPVLGGRLLAMC